MNPTPKRISAAVLSLALGFTIAGASMIAPVASAQLVGGAVSTVNLTEDVELNIDKYIGETLENGGDLNTRLGDVTFTVQKVEVPALNTLAGWNAVNAAQADLEAGNALSLTGDSWAKTTTTTAGVSFTTQDDTGFGVGLYLVTESHNQNYTVAKPFLVALPYTDENGVWSYSQAVSPKNQTVSIEKDVNDANARLGDEINYTISASIPAEALTSLIIEDELPAELGQASGIVVRTTGVTNVGDSDTTLVPVDDYTVVDNGASSDVNETNDNDLTITLTEAGLDKINALRVANPGLQIVVEFAAEIVVLPANGVISNDAGVTYPNTAISTEDDPEGGTETRLGSLTVTKVDEAGDAISDQADTGFAATFELWRCSLNNGIWEVSGSALPVITDPDTDTSAELPAAPDTLPTDFSTDPTTGIATVYGVQAFNFVNNTVLDPTTEISRLCLVETKAPKGYTMNPQPVPVQTYANTDPAAGNYAMTANVTNLEDTITGQLPATGGNGTMILIGAGVLVAAAGGAAAVRGNRARKN